MYSDSTTNYDSMLITYPRAFSISDIKNSDLILLNACVWKNICFFARLDSTMPSCKHADDKKVYYNIIYGWHDRRCKGKFNLSRKSFRYSEFKTLFTYLDAKYNISPYFPAFPKKHWWGNTSPKVVNHRIKVFDIILKNINTIKFIDKDEALQMFFHVDLRQGREMSDDDEINIVNDNTLNWEEVDVEVSDDINSIIAMPKRQRLPYIKDQIQQQAQIQKQASTFNADAYIIDEEGNGIKVNDSNESDSDNINENVNGYECL